MAGLEALQRVLGRAIAFSTTGYPEKVARRLRAVNIICWSVALLIGQFTIRRLSDPSPGMFRIGLLGILISLTFTLIPLLHRIGPRAAMFTVATLVYIDVFRVTWDGGIGGGYWFGYVTAITLIVLLLGAENAVLSTALSISALALMLFLHTHVPYNSGELSPELLHNALLTNVVFHSVLIFAVVMYATRQIARAETEAETERARSDALLANILPPAVAEQLRGAPGRVIADRFENASVLFADMAGFTARSGAMRPEELVRFLDHVFGVFDQLTARHGAEKIKTNGDGYMVAAGLPSPRPDHAEALAGLAIDMLEAARGFEGDVRIRIGIASGPVVAGVVGSAKFFYDVWGDTVNIASRMESTSENGRIQVSSSTAALLADTFALEPRGMIEVKGKGPMQTWYLVDPQFRDAKTQAPPVPGNERRASNQSVTDQS